MNSVLAGLGLLAAATSLVPAGGDASRELWVVRFEDFVHPARRDEFRQRAEAAGGRWGAIDRSGRPVVREKTRDEVFKALQAQGFGRPTRDGAWRR